jgi:hypothetical protein
LNDVCIAQFVDATLSRNTDFLANFFCHRIANAMNISQGNNDALGSRNVNTSYTSHLLLLFTVPGGVAPLKGQQFCEFCRFLLSSLGSANYMNFAPPVNCKPLENPD